MDVLIGVSVLLKKKVDAKDIHLLIDGVNGGRKRFPFPPDIQLDSRPVHDYGDILKDNSYENIVVFVTGHGGMDGMDTTPPLKPYAFYESLKTAPNLKHAVVFFCQCEAGIYNYVDLRPHKETDNKSDIVAIGAAGLHSSLSMEMLQGIHASLNVFLTHVYFWILDPVDMDGDGHCSVMDCYKYATIKTYEMCKQSELTHSISTEAVKVKLSTFDDEHKDRELTEEEDLQRKAMVMSLGLTDFNQTPWILNAYPAMGMFFE